MAGLPRTWPLFSWGFATRHSGRICRSSGEVFVHGPPPLRLTLAQQDHPLMSCWNVWTGSALSDIKASIAGERALSSVVTALALACGASRKRPHPPLTKFDDRVARETFFLQNSSDTASICSSPWKRVGRVTRSEKARSRGIGPLAEHSKPSTWSVCTGVCTDQPRIGLERGDRLGKVGRKERKRASRPSRLGVCARNRPDLPGERRGRAGTVKAKVCTIARTPEGVDDAERRRESDAERGERARSPWPERSAAAAGGGGRRVDRRVAKVAPCLRPTCQVFLACVVQLLLRRAQEAPHHPRPSVPFAGPGTLRSVGFPFSKRAGSVGRPPVPPHRAPWAA